MSWSRLRDPGEPRRGNNDDGTVLRHFATRAPRRRPRLKPGPTSEGHRDTVEAIVVAFILALVVRGFEAQAFVIPTGSMAPTLMGRHKELACPQCGFLYAVNASEEVEPRSTTTAMTVYLFRRLRELPVSGTCEPCRVSRATASW